jgi:hypothetical protein
MSTIVIMPGGFHPFHAGHAALYNSAQRAFPDAEVYVAATNDTSTRPFPFAVKEKLAKLAGVDAGHFVQVKSPFQAKEITSQFDPESDRLIFVRSEKDANKPPQAGGVKKDGNPAYLQPLLGATKLEPFARHAYMAYLPTVEFGPGMTSATEIRTAWPTLNPKRKTALVMSLYPDTQKNPKLAANVVAMLDTAIGSELAEGKDINPRMIDVFYRPIQNSRARRVVARNIPSSVLDRLLEKLSNKFSVPVSSFEWTAADTVDENQGFAATLEAKNKCPPATQDITLNLKNRQKAIDEYGYGPLNPDMPNRKFWMKKVDEWNLDSMEEAQQSLCGNCAAFDIRQDTLDCIAQGIDADSPEDAEGVIDAGDLGYCKFLKFKCASRRTCDAWVTGGPLIDKPGVTEMDGQNFVGGMTASYQQRENQPVDEDYIEEKWSQKYKSSINCASPKGFSQKAHCAGRKK